jgi:hypothetical protein
MRMYRSAATQEGAVALATLAVPAVQAVAVPAIAVLVVPEQTARAAEEMASK